LNKLRKGDWLLNDFQYSGGYVSRSCIAALKDFSYAGSRGLTGKARRRLPNIAVPGKVAVAMLAIRHMKTSAIDGNSKDQAMQCKQPNAKVEAAVTIKIIGTSSF
jgi:hypothetical protein